MGESGWRGGPDGDEIARLRGGARACGEARQALPDRRARRRGRPAAGHRRLGAAADSAQGADLRQEAREMRNMKINKVSYFFRMAELPSLTRAANVDGGLQLTCSITVEERDRPALVAESIVRRYLAKGAR